MPLEKLVRAQTLRVIYHRNFIIIHLEKFNIGFQGKFIMALTHGCPYFHLLNTKIFIMLSLEVKTLTKVLAIVYNNML